MKKMSLYEDYVKSSESLFLQMLKKDPGVSKALTDLESEINLAPLAQPLPDYSPLHILIIAPHPDDECLMGAYALRLKEEQGAQVWVLPFSYGSKLERQAARKQELEAAVKHLGFQLLDAISHDQHSLNELIEKLKINMVFTPHAEDAHPVHQAVHVWIKTWLETSKSKMIWVQTEFWRDMAEPNLLVPLTTKYVARIGEALQCHRGEVARNPYHLRLPAWFQDQVRKGSERVSGKGSATVLSVFGQIYQISFSNCK